MGGRILIMTTSIDKWRLPKGKLNIRHRQMRGCWQSFAGNNYIDLASGDTPEEAINEIRRLYEYTQGTPVIIHGLRVSKTITL